MGAGTVLWATLDRKAILPGGQIFTKINEINVNTHLPADFSQLPSDALRKLQWLADESRCHVSDSPALMAGCVRERIAKVRAKALAYKERYEALRDLDRVYFENLHLEGLVPYTIHMKPDAVGNGLGEGLR